MGDDDMSKLSKAGQQWWEWWCDPKHASKGMPSYEIQKISRRDWQIITQACIVTIKLTT